MEHDAAYAAEKQGLSMEQLRQGDSNELAEEWGSDSEGADSPKGPQGHLLRQPFLSTHSPGTNLPLATSVHTCTRCVCGLFLSWVLLGCAAILALTPHIPVVNVCNTQFDWGSIVHSLSRAQVEADYQLLLSVYNPNIVNVHLNSGTAVLKHSHTEVGNIILEPFMAHAGHITDILLTIAISSETWDDLQLGLEFYTGALTFFMDAQISASLMVLGAQTFPFSFSVNDYFIK
ncbi:unnamed protein product, partial [Chrysoparadoxa australica]